MVLEGHHRLDALQQRISDTLRALPGARALYLFGSRLTDPSDPSADVDLHVVTDTLDIARQVWPHILEQVAPIHMAWPLTSSPDTLAYTIEFEGEHLFHKVDISLSSFTEYLHDILVTNTYCALWEQPAPQEVISVPSPQAYMPRAGSVGYALFDDLLGTIRYVKARKRQQPLTCWRFARSKPDLLFRLCMEQQRLWREELPPLTTWDYKVLDKEHHPLLDDALEHLNWSTPQHMDANVYWFTEQIARLYLLKAAARQETIPLRLVDDHMQCMATELKL